MPRRILQIFAKAPVPGQVKTRLAADIGEEQACEVYQSLLLNTVKNTVGSCWETELWCAPDRSDPFLQALGQRYSIALEPQSHGNIGERMLFALQQGQHKAGKVVLIGTDCPVITSAYITAAFNALDASDVVFGPVEDGGYILVGCRNTHLSMFDDVRWSSATTLSDNISAISHCDLGYELLPMLWDLDTAKDLLRWQA